MMGVLKVIDNESAQGYGYWYKVEKITEKWINPLFKFWPRRSHRVFKKISRLNKKQFLDLQLQGSTFFIGTKRQPYYIGSNTTV